MAVFCFAYLVCFLNFFFYYFFFFFFFGHAFYMYNFFSSLIDSRQMTRELTTEEEKIPVFWLITLYSEYRNISRLSFSVVPDVGLKFTSLGSSGKSACLDSVVLEIQASLA